jgi:tRNA dimethylallyltransferase
LENSVIVIVGPTCSGKSVLGIKLAEKLKSEIISADSRQFYTKLNIGTAKPPSSDLKKINHHFIDSLQPDEEYNVSIYSEQAEKIINSLLLKNKTPIVVGGSGLYIKALIDGIVETADKDEDYRKELFKIKYQDGISKLYEMLQKADPVSASKMLPQNWKRVMRALEVFHTTGKPIWQHQQLQQRKNKFNFIQFGLDWPRDILYTNINKRVDEMILNGLVEEVKSLIDHGFSEISTR